MTGAWTYCAKGGIAALLCGLALPAQAHKASDAYLQLRGGGVPTTLRVDVALRDLDIALDLDSNGDGKLTWGEVRTAWPLMETYLRSRTELVGCSLEPVARALERRIDGVYAALTLQSPCTPSQAPQIRYGVMEGVDPTHRGIVNVEWNDKRNALRVLEPQHVRVDLTPKNLQSNSGAAARTEVPESTASAGERPSIEEPTFQFVREGIRHILTGYDHILFLICLLLPAVLRRSASGWQPVTTLRQAILPVAGIVTAFTVAHSITLALAATQSVVLSPAFIEPAIAVTIMLAALDNIWPVFHGRRVLVTFVFGLIHGFGFAGVLAELQLPVAQFAWALFQFNLGIEIGQLLIVTVLTVGLFALRSLQSYRLVFIHAGSVLAMTIAALWLVERVANISLLPSWQ